MKKTWIIVLVGLCFLGVSVNSFAQMVDPKKQKHHVKRHAKTTAPKTKAAAAKAVEKPSASVPKSTEDVKKDIKDTKEIYGHTKILASQKQIPVTIELPQEDINFEGDRVHLRRLFFNLLNNAIKFIPKGETIAIVLKRINNQIHVLIQDTGEGIATEHLSKIFDKFYRIPREDESAETETSGSGLGLSIAIAIAKAHRGTIEVESRLGVGTAFTVMFPTA